MLPDILFFAIGALSALAVLAAVALRRLSGLRRD
jgi:hypothetical protein